jgi:hypothetical protein
MAAIDELRPAMLGSAAGRTTVHDVRVETHDDSSGDEALFVIIVLGDPPEGTESWPVEDLRFLRSRVRDVLSRLDLPQRWYVVFEPEHQDLDEEEDQLELGM